MGATSSHLSVTLPDSHFLSRASQVSLSTSSDPNFTSSSSQVPSARPDTTTLASADYDVDVRSGFLPPTEPLCRLPPGPWQVWEEAWDASAGLRPGLGERRDPMTKRWRTAVREQMEVVFVQPLAEKVEWLRRARAVLAFLTHAYVNSAEVGEKGPEGELVPKALAVPLCEVSELLDMPPVLAYADTVLYNWRLKDPAFGYTPSNIEMPLSFTRTPSEAHFYRVSFLVETLAPACLTLMRSCLDEAFLADALSVTRITDHLSHLALLIDRVRTVLDTMREGCEPKVFYWEVRPWFNGGKWIMEGVPPKEGGETSLEGWRITQYGGPSAGQSTLIHTFDVFLGVDHRPRPHHAASSSDAVAPASSKTSNLPSPTDEETFMERMAYYMPHHHRAFLRHLSASLSPSSIATSLPHVPSPTHSVRSLALASPPHSALRSAYDAAVTALEELRNSHSRVALLYIVSQSRVEPPEGSAFWVEWKEKMDKEWERAQARRDGGVVQEREVYKGTGGTDLARFLKRCRERTREAWVGARAVDEGGMP